MNASEQALTPAMRAEIHERKAAEERARAAGSSILHRPYCGCRSSWTSGFRDPGCTVL